jgi:hypothetical protein
MPFGRFPGRSSLGFLLGDRVPVVGRLRGRGTDVLRGNRHQYSRLAGTTGSELNVGGRPRDTVIYNTSVVTIDWKTAA